MITFNDLPSCEQWFLQLTQSGYYAAQTPFEDAIQIFGSWAADGSALPGFRQRLTEMRNDLVEIRRRAQLPSIGAPSTI